MKMLEEWLSGREEFFSDIADGLNDIADGLNDFGDFVSCMFGSCPKRKRELNTEWRLDEERQQFYRWNSMTCQRTEGSCYLPDPFSALRCNNGHTQYCNNCWER